MTHEKLLKTLSGEEPIYVRDILYSALRAVVELHKPCEPVSDDNFITCLTCNYEYHREYPWPCETIQVIEKELI